MPDHLSKAYKILNIPHAEIMKHGGKFDAEALKFYEEKAVARNKAYASLHRLGDVSEVNEEINNAVKILADGKNVPQAFAEYELEIAQAEQAKAAKDVTEQAARVNDMEKKRLAGSEPKPIEALRAEAHMPSSQGRIMNTSDLGRVAADGVLESGTKVTRSFDNTEVLRIKLEAVNEDLLLNTQLKISDIKIDAARANTHNFRPIDPNKPSITMLRKGGEVIEIPAQEITRLQEIRNGDSLRRVPTPKPGNFDQVYNDLGIDENRVRKMQQAGEKFTPAQIDDYVRAAHENIDAFPHAGLATDTPAQKEARDRVNELGRALKDPELQKAASEELKLRDAQAVLKHKEIALKSKNGALEQIEMRAHPVAVRSIEDIREEIKRTGKIRGNEVRRYFAGELLKDGVEVERNGAKFVRVPFTPDPVTGEIPGDLKGIMKLSGVSDVDFDAVMANSAGNFDPTKPRFASNRGGSFLELPESTAQALTAEMNGVTAAKRVPPGMQRPSGPNFNNDTSSLLEPVEREVALERGQLLREANQPRPLNYVERQQAQARPRTVAEPKLPAPATGEVLAEVAVEDAAALSKAAPKALKPLVERLLSTGGKALGYGAVAAEVTKAGLAAQAAAINASGDNKTVTGNLAGTDAGVRSLTESVVGMPEAMVVGVPTLAVTAAKKLNELSPTTRNVKDAALSMLPEGATKTVLQQVIPGDDTRLIDGRSDDRFSQTLQTLDNAHKAIKTQTDKVVDAVAAPFKPITIDDAPRQFKMASSNGVISEYANKKGVPLDDLDNGKMNATQRLLFLAGAARYANTKLDENEKTGETLPVFSMMPRNMLTPYEKTKAHYMGALQELSRLQQEVGKEAHAEQLAAAQPVTVTPTGMTAGAATGAARTTAETTVGRHDQPTREAQEGMKPKTLPMAEATPDSKVSTRTGGQNPPSANGR